MLVHYMEGIILIDPQMNRKWQVFFFFGCSSKRCVCQEEEDASCEDLGLNTLVKLID